MAMPSCFAVAETLPLSSAILGNRSLNIMAFEISLIPAHAVGLFCLDESKNLYTPLLT